MCTYMYIKLSGSCEYVDSYWNVIKWHRLRSHVWYRKITAGARFNEALVRYVKLRMRRKCFPRRRGFPIPTSRHHGTCVAYVPWWMPGSLTRDSVGEKTFPAFAAHAQPASLRLVRSPYRDHLTRYQDTHYMNKFRDCPTSIMGIIIAVTQ